MFCVKLQHLAVLLNTSKHCSGHYWCLVVLKGSTGEKKYFFEVFFEGLSLNTFKFKDQKEPKKLDVFANAVKVVSHFRDRKTNRFFESFGPYPPPPITYLENK